MTEGLKWTVNNVARSDDKFLDLMSEANVRKANEFHKSFPQYTVTPLQKLSALASYLGVKNIYCKDESYRFGLNAFKVLGGSYAMGRYIAKELDKDISELPYAVLSSDKLREEFVQMETTAAVLHGLQTVSDRRQLYACQKAQPKQDLTILPKKALLLLLKKSIMMTV